MVIWKITHEYKDYSGSGYVGYWPTKRSAIKACRDRKIPIRDAEITKLTLKSKYDAIDALYNALVIDTLYVDGM
jgi:hypothetical protein